MIAVRLPALVVSLPFSTSSHNTWNLLQVFFAVVSLPFSTSSHNNYTVSVSGLELYLFPFLHQATTPKVPDIVDIGLYLFPFLHQATTVALLMANMSGCISSLFYIKPQRNLGRFQVERVVSLPFSTSSHNLRCFIKSLLAVVSLPFSTSSHNSCYCRMY